MLRRRAMMGAAKAGYQFVEYIQSDGNQYIDTGVALTVPCQIIAEMEVINKVACGSFNSSLNARDILVTRQSGTVYVQAGRYTNWGISLTGKIKFDVSAKSDGCAYLVINNGYSSANFPYTVFDTAGNIYLFAYNLNSNIGAGVATDNGTVKLYSFAIYNNSVLVRNFVPCYKKSTGEIGLYDTVNDQFYTNQGTGTFAKGPDV